MITFEKLQLVKATIIQLVVYQIIPISKNIIKLITIDLSKQQKLDANQKEIQKISFTGNLDQDGNKMFFIIEEAKETVSDFQKGTVRVL